jgi:hypothetical protein
LRCERCGSKKDLRTLQESHEDFGLKESHAKEAYKILKAGTPGWREYLKCIENNTSTKRGEPLPTQTASFATVLHNQREILERPSSKNDEAKFYRSPIKLRPREPSKTIPPQTPQRAVLQTFGTPFDVPSPIDEDIPTPVPAADEQIVNIALIGFLQGFTVYQRRCADWTIQRKVFSCGPKGSTAEFQARTDGALQYYLDQRCMAIIEVKARRRYGQHQIQMQESAQMAAWIYTEPESYWEVDKNPGMR